MGLSKVEHEKLSSKILEGKNVSKEDLIRVERSRRTSDDVVKAAREMLREKGVTKFSDRDKIPKAKSREVDQFKSNGIVVDILTPRENKVREESPTCGVCEGVGMYKSTSRKKIPNMTCWLCKGSGEGETVFDVDGKQVLPGDLVRFIPQVVMCGEEEVKSYGYKGEVKFVGISDKHGPYVQIQALPSLSGSKRTRNHGYRAEVSNNVRVIKGTRQSRLVDRYQEKKEVLSGNGS